MEPNKDVLMAFVDNELPPEERERIARLLAERPDLENWVRIQQSLRSRMTQALEQVVSEPPPERLVNAALKTPISLRWRLKAWARQLSLLRLFPVGAALAAGLVIGVLAAPTKDLSLGAEGQLEAQGPLRHVLQSGLASAGYEGTGPRIGISYRNRAGQDCRTFELDAQSGIACHEHGRWTISLIVHRPTPPHGTYAMAGSGMPNTVLQAVESDIQGQPFDAAAERAARDHGWN